MLMDDTLRVFASVTGGVGLGQLLLFWVTRRSRKLDTRDEQALTLETSFLAERRELLASLRGQLAGEQARAAKLETEKSELMQQLVTLHKIANEVVAKYDFLRTLNPEANLPSIRLDPPIPGVITITTAAPNATLPSPSPDPAPPSP